MKAVSKAPTYLPPHSASTYRSLPGKKTLMDSMTTKPPNSKKNFLKFKALAKSSETGMVSFYLLRRSNHYHLKR